MERSQLFDLMGELQLYGMKAAFDEVMTTAIKRQHEPQRIIGDLLTAEINEKQARSIGMSPRDFETESPPQDRRAPGVPRGGERREDRRAQLRRVLIRLDVGDGLPAGLIRTHSNSGPPAGVALANLPPSGAQLGTPPAAVPGNSRSPASSSFKTATDRRTWCRHRRHR
jgi:hypothetical protein